MNRCRLYILLFFLLLPSQAFTQNSILSLGLWNLSALSGELKLGGLYGEGFSNTYGVNDKQTLSSYYGGIMLKTSSYIWTPNFFVFDVDGGYLPESRQDLYVVYQNQFDVINMTQLHMSASIFPKRPLTLSGFLNYDNSYDNRENLTSLKTNSKNYGGTFSFANRYLPLSICYNQSNWDTREIQTGRSFKYDQKNLDARVSRSFGLKDKNDLMYSHHDFLRDEYDIMPIRNISDILQLSNGIFFDSSKNSHFNSNIAGTIQHGADSFKQFRATENLFYKLPYNMYWNSTYGYYYIDRSNDVLGTHSFSTNLGHQLYQSLHSDLLYEYNNAQDSYHEVNNKGGINLLYTKKIFANGLLNIGYSYYRMHEARVSQDFLLQIMNEQCTFSGSKMVLLKNPYVDSNSVIVKDITGTIIYQNGFDYRLMRWGSFVEIQRVPGGQIPDNSSVYVSYNATQPGSYQYDVNMNNFSANVSLFNRLVDIYFRANKTGYDHIRFADNLVINYLTEYLYGTRLEYKFAVLGAEYDDYQSSVTPYKMTRFFLTLQADYHHRLLLSLNANYRDYNVPGETEDRIYEDVNALATYAISHRTKLDLNVGYQYQHGSQIDLDLLTSRIKLSTLVRGITLSGGIDMYDRIYLENQRTSYLGAYMQITKKFKY